MATTTSITTTYAGEKAAGYISAALLSANTIENGGITVKPNVKFKQVIKRLSTTDLIADGSCDFAATDTVTLDEKILQPEEFQVNLNLCKTDFRDDWDAISMGYSAFDNLPPSFQEFLIAEIIAKIAEKNESNIWMGATAVAGQFDGLVALATADATVIDVTGVSTGAGGVTSANVIAELGKVTDAMPAALYGKPDVRLYVAQNVYKAYVRALGGFGADGLGANGYEGKGNNQSISGLMFDGVQIFLAQGLDPNYMYLAETSNIFFGTGLLSDHNEVKVLDMSDLDGSQNVRFVMRFTAGVQHGFGSDIVLYTPVA
tara:strand:- start:542 stop:1489 length:948 start_codon:yes stop_codon:yes gene_type:complete